MTQPNSVCASCGAHLNDADKECQLCGFPVDDELTIDNALPSAVEVYKDLPEPTEVDEGAPAVEEAVQRSGSLGPIVFLAGLLLVAALYLVSSLSNSNLETEPATTSVSDFEPDEAAFEPLAAAVVENVARLRDEADALSGTQRLDKLRELAVLYQQEFRFDLAGDTQADIARESGMEMDWVRSGNLYYDWMENQVGNGKAYYAKKAIASYQEALAISPDNLDVRTDMAVAYLFDPDNPMEAILNTNRVLEADSLHLQANFNRGIMLMQINRMDDALAQFQKVVRLEPNENHPVNRRAVEAIKLLEARSDRDAQ